VLAERIQEAVRNDIQPENTRKTKQGDGIYILENVTNPAVMIECGFLTNSEECEKLSEENYQNQLSFSVIRAIIEYIEGKNT
jgi:N-acetylmuramoyl-L-alanine amidase